MLLCIMYSSNGTLLTSYAQRVRYQHTEGVRFHQIATHFLGQGWNKLISGLALCGYAVSVPGVCSQQREQFGEGFGENLTSCRGLIIIDMQNYFLILDMLKPQNNIIMLPQHLRSKLKSSLANKTSKSFRSLSADH